MAKSAMMTTADPNVLDSDQTTPAGPFDMGSGHLNPGKVAKKGSSFNPGLVYDAGFFDYSAFICGASPGVFSAGSCAFLAASGFSDRRVRSELPVDRHRRHRRVADGDPHRHERCRPDGDVEGRRARAVPVSTPSSSPARSRSLRATSASYTVTFTANGAVPAGEWTFGDLVWNGSGGYAARSPIALKGALIGAPEELNGTGTAGSLELRGRLRVLRPVHGGAPRAGARGAA